MGGVDPPPIRTDAGAASRSGWRRVGQLGWTPNRLRLRAAVQRMNSQLKNGEVRKTGYHRIMMSFPDVSRTDIALKIFKPHDRV